jgi:hypothetical protein
MPIKIEVAIVPPDRSALAQRMLCFIARSMCPVLRVAIALSPDNANRAAGKHKRANRRIATRFREVGIGHAPQTGAHYKLSPVGRHSVASDA